MTIEQSTELSLAERQKLVIASVRERLLQLPNTTVSFKVKNPELTTLSLSLINREDEECNIECSPNSLSAKKSHKEYGGGTGEAINISPTLVAYINWPERIYVNGIDAIEEIERSIDSFLPQVAKQ